MTLLIPNYNSPQRIALVQKHADPCTIQNHEIMVLCEDSVFLPRTQERFALDEAACRFNELLHSGDIVSISNTGLVYRLYDINDSDATVFLTGQCNSNCIMCPCSDWERQYNIGTSDDWMREYIEMLPPNLRHICVTGGEPTLKTEQFFMVMELLAEKYPNSNVLLLTNGRSFASTAMVNRLINKCPPYLEIAIPIHGHSAALHDSISRADGSLAQTTQGIKNLLAKRIPIELRVVVSKINSPYLEDVARYIVSEFPSAKIVNFIGLEAMGNCAKNFQKVYIDYTESFSFIKPAIGVLVSAGMDVSLYNYPLCTVERGFWTLCQQSITPYKVKYPDECEQCEAKDYCGGFFNSTLGVAKPIVKPIRF